MSRSVLGREASREITHLSARSGLCLRTVRMARYSVLASVLQNRRQRNRQIIGHDARSLAQRLLRDHPRTLQERRRY
jgi:hypothetical protein